MTVSAEAVTKEFKTGRDKKLTMNPSLNIPANSNIIPTKRVKVIESAMYWEGFWIGSEYWLKTLPNNSETTEKGPTEIVLPVPKSIYKNTGTTREYKLFKKKIYFKKKIQKICIFYFYPNWGGSLANWANAIPESFDRFKIF